MSVYTHFRTYLRCLSDSEEIGSVCETPPRMSKWTQSRLYETQFTEKPISALQHTEIAISGAFGVRLPENPSKGRFEKYSQFL